MLHSRATGVVNKAFLCIFIKGTLFDFDNIIMIQYGPRSLTIT